jgi:hypothetical protein
MDRKISITRSRLVIFLSPMFLSAGDFTMTYKSCPAYVNLPSFAVQPRS